MVEHLKSSVGKVKYRKLKKSTKTHIL